VTQLPDTGAGVSPPHDPFMRSRATARRALQPLPAVPEPPRVHETPVLGIPLALTDYEETLDWIDASVSSDTQGYICVAAVHTVVASQDDPELREAVLGASFTVPDGQPLVWAMNALGHDLSSRVYGPELMERACERAAKTGLRFYLYGGRDQGALVQLALNLRRRHPGVRIVGGYSPPYRNLSAEEEEAIVTEINESGADVVWVGIGVPKQEKWMARMRDRLSAPVLVGVGAACDFLGLEWAFRLAHEPRRLWKRYLTYNPRFVAGFARQYARHRARLGR
jgi:N-acetylglucosaminyldiphosphoundecaprenol N-acetyl-beta-D-mannosaminyltransferase